MFNSDKAKNIIDNLINQGPNTSTHPKSAINIEHSKNVKIVLAKNDMWICVLIVLALISYVLIQGIF